MNEVNKSPKYLVLSATFLSKQKDFLRFLMKSSINMSMLFQKDQIKSN